MGTRSQQNRWKWKSWPTSKARHISWKDCSRPLSLAYKLVKDTLRNQWRLRWSRSTSQARIIWPDINLKQTNTFLSKKRSVIKASIDAITGHWAIGKHATRIKLSDVQNCRCNITSEGIDEYHYWCDCPCLAWLKMEALDEFFLPEFKAINSNNLTKRISFICRSRWFTNV